jgi:hypothetical protein
MDLAELRPGDRLRISCEPRSVEVAHTSRTYLFVRRPWLQIDPASRFSYDGTAAFAKDPNHPDFDLLWRIHPTPTDLHTGDTCELSIPPAEVVLASVERFVPPKDLGWLPRPSAALYLLPSSGDDDGEGGQALYLSPEEPIAIERLATKKARSWGFRR